MPPPNLQTSTQLTTQPPGHPQKPHPTHKPITKSTKMKPNTNQASSAQAIPEIDSTIMQMNSQYQQKLEKINKQLSDTYSSPKNSDEEDYPKVLKPPGDNYAASKKLQKTEPCEDAGVGYAFNAGGFFLETVLNPFVAHSNVQHACTIHSINPTHHLSHLSTEVNQKPTRVTRERIHKLYLEYTIQNNQVTRNTEPLKTKFKSFVMSKKPTGNPSCPVRLLWMEKKEIIVLMRGEFFFLSHSQSQLLTMISIFFRNGVSNPVPPLPDVAQMQSMLGTQLSGWSETQHKDVIELDANDPDSADPSHSPISKILFTKTFNCHFQHLWGIPLYQQLAGRHSSLACCFFFLIQTLGRLLIWSLPCHDSIRHNSKKPPLKSTTCKTMFYKMVSIFRSRACMTSCKRCTKNWPPKLLKTRPCNITWSFNNSKWSSHPTQPWGIILA
ncbi:uncharacterized protein VP01_92g2 [Puccinia sorghi]|uniref:Uncharacterized protein n=1 Tax=Puccinia sorghi TaxID=27349 RepID=A0A0L6U7H0_9BASI|nr:uncharacterized protein VP01_92g2 [Puccinia sorghi]